VTEPHPRRRRQPAKSRAIIDAARRVFLTHGFVGGSVDAIAAAAGVSKQTIYNHYGDKDALFRAVVRASQPDVDTRVAAMEQTLSGSTDLAADLRLAGRRWVTEALDPGVASLRRLVIAEWDRHPWLLDEWRRAGRTQEAALGRAIAHQQARGALEVPDPARAAHQLLLLTVTEALTRAVYGARRLSGTEVADVVDSGVDMWLRAYQARPHRGAP
jgi:TetR/AcrR family transcriptional repressor of mexJK operon